MKRNIIILSILSFLISATLLYFFVEIVYKEKLNYQINLVQENIVSNIELISPEIKTAFSKSDDIALLYSIEKLSKVNNVIESFIINNELKILIHNDSSKWNKKYEDNFYKELVTKKEMSIQKTDMTTFVYSLPLNETSVLCVKFSLENVYKFLNNWKIKLYVFCFIISFLLLFIVYYLSKFLFLYPFNKAKKYLSMNNTSSKTIYSDIVDMTLSCNQNQDFQVEKDDDNSLQSLIDAIFKSYISISDEIFIVLDNKARLVYCVDTDNIILENQEIGSHIVQLTKNSSLIKSISNILENPLDVINIDIDTCKVNITPLKDDQDLFIGIIISGNTIKDRF